MNSLDLQFVRNEKLTLRNIPMAKKNLKHGNIYQSVVS